MQHGCCWHRCKIHVGHSSCWYIACYYKSWSFCSKICPMVYSTHGTVTIMGQWALPVQFALVRNVRNLDPQVRFSVLFLANRAYFYIQFHLIRCCKISAWELLHGNLLCVVQWCSKSGCITIPGMHVDLHGLSSNVGCRFLRTSHEKLALYNVEYLWIGSFLEKIRATNTCIGQQVVEVNTNCIDVMHLNILLLQWFYITYDKYFIAHIWSYVLFIGDNSHC